MKILFCLFFLLIFSSSIASAVVNCGTNISTGTYTLSGNINSTGNCLNINSSNVLIDCMKYSITSNAGTGTGIKSVYNLNTTIQNCSIINYTTGIDLSNTNYSVINGNSINASGDGIYAAGNNYYDNVSNNVIYAVDKGAGFPHAINFGGSYNSFWNNYASATGIYGDGFQEYNSQANHNNFFNNNTWVANGSYCDAFSLGYSTISTVANSTMISYGGGRGIFLVGPSVQADTFTNLNVTNYDTTAGSYGIYFLSATNNVVKNSIVKSYADYDIYVDDTAGSPAYNNTLLNVTYTTEHITDGGAAGGGSLIRQWYYRGYAGVSGVIISAYNVSGALMFSAVTDATGYTPLQKITDYTDFYLIGKTYYSPYTIIATNSYLTTNHTLNASLGNSYTDSFNGFTSASATTGFCSNVTSGMGNFFTGIIVIFGILAVGIIILILFVLVAAAGGENVQIDVNEIIENFPVRIVFMSILGITVLVWVIIQIFGVLCSL